jgi:hypothetical protein
VTGYLEALAAYYNASPTIFGMKFDNKTTGGTIPEKINKAKDNSVDTANALTSGTSEDLDKFMDFGMFIPRVIELAWNNEIFKINYSNRIRTEKVTIVMFLTKITIKRGS